MVADQFVWILEISGAVPPAHLVGGYAGAMGERQPPMYFPLGGSTIKGLSKPGWVVWSRVFVAGNRLNCDIGLGQAVSVPEEIAKDNWAQTTPQWPMMHLVLRGISRDQFISDYSGQVLYLNKLTLAALDQLTAHDPDAIILVMGDEGSGVGMDWEDVDSVSQTDLAERFANLFSARTPGQEADLPTLTEIE